ncbi:MAG: Rho termination factor N-terminal domain-containing protein, partial [Pseudomonadota bacterium]
MHDPAAAPSPAEDISDASVDSPISSNDGDVATAGETAKAENEGGSGSSANGSAPPRRGRGRNRNGSKAAASGGDAGQRGEPMNLTDLKTKSTQELIDIAASIGLDNLARSRKQDII